MAVLDPSFNNNVLIFDYVLLAINFTLFTHIKSLYASLYILLLLILCGWIREEVYNYLECVFLYNFVITFLTDFS